MIYTFFFSKDAVCFSLIYYLFFFDSITKFFSGPLDIHEGVLGEMIVDANQISNGGDQTSVKIGVVWVQSPDGINGRSLIQLPNSGCI